MADIEIATKYTSSDAADMSYDFYMAELGANAGKFVKLPFEIEYRLINESEWFRKGVIIIGRSTVYNNITSPELIDKILPENKMLEEDFLEYL